MIRNRSPPGVCWLTVRAVGGILKTFITIFSPGSGCDLPHCTQSNTGLVQRNLALFRDKEISKKFPENFTDFCKSL